VGPEPAREVVLVRPADGLPDTGDGSVFSWILQGTGQAQTAYQIVLTDGDTALRDSGLVESSSTVDVAYGGPPLAGGTRYRWKVQAWDETGAASGWSAPAAFETGFLDRTGGWHASSTSRRAPPVSKSFWSGRTPAAR
jgi:alpha-L-rhamnosidase